MTSTSEHQQGNFKAVILEREKELQELYDRKITSLEDDNKRKEASLEKIRKKYESLKKDFQYNLNLLEERDKELDRYDKSFIELKDILKQRDNSITELNSTVSGLQANVEKEQARNNDMEAYYQERIQNLQNDISNAQRDKRELTDQLRDQDRKIHRLESELSMSEKDGDEKANLQNAKRQLSYQLREKDREINRLESELSRSKSDTEYEIHKLKKDLQDTKRKLEDKDQKYENLHQEFYYYKNRLQSFREESSNAQTERFQLENLIREKDQKIHQLENELSSSKSSINNQVEQLKLDLQDYQRKLEEKTQSYENLYQEHSEKLRQFTELEQQKKQLEYEISRYRDSESHKQFHQNLEPDEKPVKQENFEKKESNIDEEKDSDLASLPPPSPLKGYSDFGFDEPKSSKGSQKSSNQEEKKPPEKEHNEEYHSQHLRNENDRLKLQVEELSAQNTMIRNVVKQMREEMENMAHNETPQRESMFSSSNIQLLLDKLEELRKDFREQKDQVKKVSLRDLKKENKSLKSKLKHAAKDLKKLVKEREKLVEISNSLRADLQHTTQEYRQQHLDDKQRNSEWNSHQISSNNTQQNHHKNYYSNHHDGPGESLVSKPPLVNQERNHEETKTSSRQNDSRDHNSNYDMMSSLNDMKFSMRRLVDSNVAIRRGIEDIASPKLKKKNFSYRDEKQSLNKGKEEGSTIEGEHRHSKIKEDEEEDEENQESDEDLGNSIRKSRQYIKASADGATERLEQLRLRLDGQKNPILERPRPPTATERATNSQKRTLNKMKKKKADFEAKRDEAYRKLYANQ